MIAVVADFPVFQESNHGGLQRKLRSLLEAFAQVCPVTLLCAAGSDLDLPGCRTVPVFDADGRLDPAGGAALATMSSQASVVVSFETVVPSEIACPVVLVLGGLAYDWSWKVVKSRRWDAVIVPSSIVQSQLARTGVASDVIPNGYDWSKFRSVPAGPDLCRLRPVTGQVLISPHRPEAVKGHREALGLTSALLERGVECTLLIPEQHFLRQDGTFYSDLRHGAEQRLPPGGVVFHPWVPAGRMPEYYSLADLTLALGEVEEGFGAFAVESIGCGTPVLSRGRGAVSELLPPGHGLHICAGGEGKTLVSIAENILARPSTAREQEMDRGRTYLKAHYDVRVMVQAYLRRIRGAAGVSLAPGSRDASEAG